jgi:hypothetical protein
MLSTGRILIGGLVAGLILFVVGFIFWATPLHEFAYKNAPDAQGAAIQLSLGQNLSQTGTGTYIIPAPHTQQGGALHSQGPIATVHFNVRGYSPDDMSMILPGFIMAVIAGLLIAFGLAAVGGGGRSFRSTAQLVILFSIGVTVWTLLAQPVFNHYGWGYWIYSFIAETTGLILAGLVVARWFLPHPRSAPDAAPADGSETPVRPE